MRIALALAGLVCLALTSAPERAVCEEDDCPAYNSACLSDFDCGGRRCGGMQCVHVEGGGYQRRCR